jgi:hypothetical protein
MPKRDQRLFWLYAKQVLPDVASHIDEVNQQFVHSWTDSDLTVVACVDADGQSDRLWLFRIDTKDPKLATKFNKRLQDHIKGLPSAINVPLLRAKRQVNLPTPLVHDRLEKWPKTDLGLHVVNDTYNAMLVTFTYDEGRYYNVPLLQLNTLEEVVKRVREAWQAVACDCHTTQGCCKFGCYNCFQLGCPRCDGTGWKDYTRWIAAGCKINYGSGLPIAKL